MLDSHRANLGLTPWRISSAEEDEDEPFYLKPHIWRHLPESLLHSVLSWLPFSSVLRFRSVCKQWKALFASPGFHHVASHKAYVPPWLFIIGSNGRRHCINDHHCCVRDDDGLSGDDDYGDSGDVHGRMYDDHGASRCESHGSRHDDHGDEDDRGSHAYNSVNSYDDHGNVNSVSRYDDHADTHDSRHNHGDLSRQGGVHSLRPPSRGSHTSDHCCYHGDTVEEMLLIFNCESESWHRPLAVPRGLTSSHISCFQELILISSISPCHLYLYNPAAPSCQELPSFISIQGMPAVLAFSEERGTLPRLVTVPNLKHLSSMPSMHENQNLGPFVQDKAGKNMQVVAVGKSLDNVLVLEVYHSSTGSWRVCGNLPSHFIFFQSRMVYCHGFFYALLSVPGTLLSLNSIVGGQKLEWTLRDTPVPLHGFTDLGKLRLVACRNRVFLIGTTLTYPTNRHGRHREQQCHILIWQFHPGADSDVCWQLLAEMPRQIFNAFYGKELHVNIECCAHGDLIFFQYQGSCQILMYDVSQDVWRFSPRCEYNIDALAFVWEPLLN